MTRFMIVAALSVTALAIASTALPARTQRIPPPPVLISGGGLPDGGDPWSLDDPFDGDGGGGGSSGGGWNDRDYGYPSSGPPIGDGGADTHGDGGWEWWNDADFWGWGSGWWRYPEPDFTDGDGESGGGNGGDDHDHALAGCRIIVTGGEDNRCDCFVHVLRDETGKIVWTDTKTYCAVDPVAVNPGCRGKNPGEPCR